ncbi:MAG: dTMP kinase [bacterium]|nr:dTMP kinase [bacterium]
MRRNDFPGKLIVFEGLDGSGQTTQARLLARWLAARLGQQAYYTKEPTAGPLGGILKLVLSHRLLPVPDEHDLKPLSAAKLALFFAGDRLDHLQHEIVPKLKEGVHVVADRYYLSSLAYQSVECEYEWVKEVNKFAIEPDLSIFLNVDPRVCLERIHTHRWQVELFEDLENLTQVHQQYQEVIGRLREDGECIEVVDGNQEVPLVHRSVVDFIHQSLLSIIVENECGSSSPEGNNLEGARYSSLTEKEIAALREG